MAVTLYDFEKLCDSQRLISEIQASNITIALDRIETGTGTDVYFRDELSEGEETTLNTLVTNHVNTPLPSEATLVTVEQEDSDTGGLLISPKFAPTGWHQQYFETEFETSNMGADSIHEKDWENNDLGFSTLKFYNAAGTLLTTQGSIDTDCTRTDLLWMPPFDYAIKSGWIAQKVVPASNIYVWAVAVDLAPEYGGVQSVFADGGINLTYVDSRAKAGLDGVSATILYYNHPQLGDGAGTNRIRFVVRHPAGFKHRLQAVFELFLA